MNDYSSPNSDLILTKTNSIVKMKLTEFPQYKSAITQDVRLRMSNSDSSQLPNVMTLDNNVSSFETINNIFKQNAFYKNT
jgi:hypothetical protein